MADLAKRGSRLRGRGYTSLRTFRILRREFPNAERYDLWVAAGERLTGTFPMWVENGSSPSEVRYRNDPRKEPA